MKRAMLAGTFDPPTFGHINIIERSSKLYDELYIVVANNINKTCMFTADERKKLLEGIFKDCNNIRVFIHDGLIVDFARQHDISVMIRGVRAVADFSYEFELAMTNKQINPNVETLFMPTDPRYFLVRSSMIKELAKFGADISTMVPDVVVGKIKEKINESAEK